MDKQNNYKQEKQLNPYIRFTSVAIQMIIIICGFSFFGNWLDGKFKNSYSLFTVIFSLIGVISALYLVIKQVMAMNKNDK